jgi:Bifunctional DNA primase/polymerase, N-terminal/AAA domain
MLTKDTTFLDTALECIARGWHVFPCKPKTKTPQLMGGFHGASNDRAQIENWWATFPDANVGIALRKSGLVVFDNDHGNANVQESRDWVLARNLAYELPATYTVRTGRRKNSITGEPESGVQLYYSFTDDQLDELNTRPWVDGLYGGEVRCSTGHVMAVGSIHDKSGELYEVLVDAPVAPVPEYVRKMKGYKTPLAPKSGPMVKIPEGGGRHDQLMSLAGVLRARGFDEDAILEMLIPANIASCVVPVSDAALERMARNVSNYPRVIDPVVVIGGKPGPGVLAASLAVAAVDSYSFFDTADQIINAEPVEFVVNNVIPKNRYTGFVALSGSRKTIIACNLVRAVLTREPFLGRFAIDNPPERVIFLAAESARSEMKDRAEKMGFIPFIQSRQLLIRTAATSTPFHQDQLPDSLLNGALVVLDTFIRFFDGLSEQDSTEARKFSAQMQRLVNAGATVVVLFHAPKAAKGGEMSIESIRGSSELGAAMACCWGLAMLGTDWKDNSQMTQVKRREFQCDPPAFDFSCDIETAICTYVDAAVAKIGGKDRTEDDALALEFLKANLSKADREIATACEKETGVERSYKWFQRHRKAKGFEMSDAHQAFSGA